MNSGGLPLVPDLSKPALNKSRMRMFEPSGSGHSGKLFPQDGIVHGLAPQGAPVRGPEGFKAFFQTIRGAFPDIKVTIHDTVVEGDKVAARWSATMTHSGKGLDIPPTGKKVQTTGMLMCRIRDGQIIESWDNWDALGLKEQLGVVPQSKMV